MVHDIDLDVIKPFQDDLWAFKFGTLINISPRESSFNLFMPIDETIPSFLSNTRGSGFSAL
jgi:hypothetical protein